MFSSIDELKNAAELLGFEYEILTGETAAAIIDKSFVTFEPFRRQGHLSIMHERSHKLRLDEHEYTFSKHLIDEPLIVFFEQTRNHVDVAFKLQKGQLFCDLLEECSGIEYFLTNENVDYLIAVNWYVIESVDNHNLTAIQTK